MNRSSHLALLVFAAVLVRGRQFKNMPETPSLWQHILIPTSGTLERNSVHEADSQDQLNRLPEQWVEQVTAVVHQVEEWAVEVQDTRRWTVERETHELAEEVVGGAYVVPGLRISAGEDELHLEPVARGVLRADGRIALYAWPSLFRVMLLRKNGEWTIRTESGWAGRRHGVGRRS